MLAARLARSLPRINGFQAHHPHQPLHTLAIHVVASPDQPLRHASRTVKGRVQILLIDQPHQSQILRRRALAGVVVRRARQAHELALLSDA
jgi:hypothetical protein